MIRRLGIGCVLLAVLAMPAVASAKQPSPGEVKNAAKHCKALRAEMGRDAFRAEFGSNKNGRNAFGKCVARNARSEHRAAKKALRECKAESAEDVAAFLEKYLSEDAEASFERPGGEGDRPPPAKPEGETPDESRPGKAPAAALRRAMHRCVKLKLRALKAERREELEAAVADCKEEFVADPVAFMEKYGPPTQAETSGEEPRIEPVDKPAGEQPGEPKLGKLLAFGRCVLSKVNATS